MGMLQFGHFLATSDLPRMSIDPRPGVSESFVIKRNIELKRNDEDRKGGAGAVQLRPLRCARDQLITENLRETQVPSEVASLAM